MQTYKYLKLQTIIAIIMKKLFALFALGIFVLSSASAALAQASAESALVQNPGALPDSFFYPFKRLGENLQLFFTFDNLEKAKLKYRLAETRLAEAGAMAALNKTELADNALNDYEADLNETADAEQALSASGRNVSELEDLVANNTYKHILVLQDVYERVPDSAKSAIRNAIENALERQGRISFENETALVNITIAVDNQTLTRQVPAAFAERFLQKADELKGRFARDVRVKNETELENDIAEKIGASKEKAQQRINEASLLISETAQKLAILNITNSAANILLVNAEERLNNSVQAFSEGKYGEAFGQAVSAESIAENAARVAESGGGARENETQGNESANSRSRVCAQVITPAVRGSQCVQFPSSCIPEGWTKVGSCPSSATSG